MLQKNSSTIANRKNHNDVLENHRCLSTKQLEQDHNGTSIVPAYKLFKSVLRIKRVTAVYCREFNMPHFLQKVIGGLLANLKPSFVKHHD